MILLVDGTPGAGKSYFAVRQIVAALAAGKSVVTNVPLSEDYAERAARENPMRRLSSSAVQRRAEDYRRRTLVTRSLDECMRVRVAGRGEGRAVIVLDEAHQWLNSRMWGKDTGRGDVVRWLSGHRHFGFDIYLISQHIEDIDKQVRNRVEYRVRLRNLKRVRIMGLRIIPCNYFVAVHELVSARQAPTAQRQFYGLSRRIAGMYSTHGLAEGDVPPDAIWLPRALEDEAGAGTPPAGAQPQPTPPNSAGMAESVKRAQRSAVGRRLTVPPSGATP